MATPYIMPLGFIDRPTETGATFILSNPEDSFSLKNRTPITVWRYSPEHLAIAKLRGYVSAVGYTTATFTTIETRRDPKWPEDQEILRPETPVYLALPDSFDPNPSRMLSQEDAEALAEKEAKYAQPEMNNPDNPEVQ